MADADALEKIAEGKLDLVPMIDTIMLLLLFFMMTTKFNAEERAIASLLPTDKGQTATTPATAVTPPNQVNIIIIPTGFQKGLQPSNYQAQLMEMRQQYASNGYILPEAWLRVGGSDYITVAGQVLNTKANEELKRKVNEVHAFIYDQLQQRETAETDRTKQLPVVISCFSGLSWKFALISYDAVRAYEAERAGSKISEDPSQWEKVREVTFAPPRIRNFHTRELGNELWELIHMM